MPQTALVLLIIAIFFLRNQIKPIQQLAQAADSFGKGQPMPGDFRPRGAEEIRRAGSAFIQMRKRIERQIEQRTAMLSGVSHDLRTILTRFKLQLALAGNQFDTAPLNQDITDMQTMLEGYLAFARGEVAEEAEPFDLNILMHKLQNEAELRNKSFTYEINGSGMIEVRPNAFSRLVSNLVTNAFRHANKISLTANHQDKDLEIIIDDDGTGIPESRREDVFKPFVRLDEARNQDAGGTGLGLAIARDIARTHGGDITLDSSHLGGLRAIIKLPA